MNNSKKTTRADNQQERLIKIGWIIGYVDGEGCFSISFLKQYDKREQNRIRRGYRSGCQVFHEFAVTQGKKSLSSLKMLQDFFGIGSIYVNKRHDNHKEPLYRYVVRKREDLLNIIIPFFREYPLRTGKQEDFEKFVQCVEMVARGKHFNKNGLIKIAAVASSMNRKKLRQPISILRDHTPTF